MQDVPLLQLISIYLYWNNICLLRIHDCANPNRGSHMELLSVTHSLSPRYWLMYNAGEGGGNATHIRVRCIGASCGTSRIGEIIVPRCGNPASLRDNAFHAWCTRGVQRSLLLNFHLFFFYVRDIYKHKRNQTSFFCASAIFSSKKFALYSKKMFRRRKGRFPSVAKINLFFASARTSLVICRI